MKIIAHRGLWQKKFEQNSAASIKSAAEAGFGIEIDIRDQDGKIVLSHDPAKHSKRLLTLQQALRIYQKNLKPCITKPKIFLDVKSNGLGKELKSHMQKNPNFDFFAFDLSVPEAIIYSKLKIPILSRVSELERFGELDQLSSGVCVDIFHSEWISKLSRQKMNRLFDRKLILFISPELHSRSHIRYWTFLKTLNSIKKNIKYKKSYLCTDFCFQAKDFFEK